ncbi:MAG: polysaccharide deacetylase family protein [Bacteroidales bacterium]|nr:polysaccharide deacetylase family protein [Bacteroidales bacterium]
MIKPSKIFRIFYPSLLWEMPKTEKKTIYLTFDDGPHPLITPKVLEILRKYDAKATFFCIGNNVKQYPETFELVKREGHSVGCHTFNHENGWKTKTDDYLKSFNDANELIHSNLFRPPHGKIKRSQLKKLVVQTWNAASLRIVAWSVIAYDWDHSLSHEDVYQNVIKNAGDGSIVTFHDSVKAYNNMISALPRVLEYYKNQGFKFKAL